MPLQMTTYFLLDSGDQEKLEKFSDVTLVRPCAQAVWRPALPKSTWQKAEAHFTREPSHRWTMRKKLPPSWVVELEGIKFKVLPTDFGHIGLFPEHALLWRWMEPRIFEGAHILNLFAYTGGASLFLAKHGAKVCHLDASKAVVAWARENAALNGLEKAPIRWIVDDVIKFLKREQKRGVKYDGILLDPPTFGRGNQGEVFKIERDLFEILELCKTLLSSRPLFFVLSTHTPGYTPLVMQHLLSQLFLEGQVEAGELFIESKWRLPSGSYARWHA